MSLIHCYINIHRFISNVCKCLSSEPPQSVMINSGVQTVDVIANSTYILQCVAAGARPAASLSWQVVFSDGIIEVLPVESVVVQTNDKLSSTTGALTIRPTVDDSGSRYGCMATNNATGASSPVVIRVQINVVCK